MRCLQCQHENREGRRFCAECGAPLAQPCPTCKFMNEPGEKFCGGCGIPLTGATSSPTPSQPAQQFDIQAAQPLQVKSPPPESPHPPDAERRQLTVMFCDLVDSTALSGQLDPEDLREVIQAYQAACTEVIQRYDGHVAQLLGDGLLVYFGYPQAHEDDAQRAIHTGLGMLDVMVTLNQRLEHEQRIRLAIRVGIHTGLVVVGEMGGVGRQEQLALGETPNVAARLQGLADPDSVVISRSTYQLAQGYFVCESLGTHTLRGVDDPMAVYRVLQPNRDQGRFDTALTLTPLVGREQEMGLLLERWAQVKAGQGQVILFTGEAGIGKSRLLQAFKATVANESDAYLECRSSPYYQNTALYPVIDLMQRRLQWQAEDTVEAKLGKLEAALRPFRLAFDESVLLFASLLSLPVPGDRYPPLLLSPQRQRQRTLEVTVAMLLQLAEQKPLLFILEDLHWTDPTTLELINLLIDQTPTAPLGVLLTCRLTFQPEWGHRSYITELTISQLHQHHVQAIVERLTGGKRLPGPILQQIVEKTDGVPLFVEELTKTILESGHLQVIDGEDELAGTVPALAIPETLQDSLMARLDRLMTAKGIAQLGAVIGRQFSYELLQLASQLDEATLRRELDRLVESEIVYQRGLPPEATYTFKHALIRDTAYGSLLRRTRQQHHLSVAAALENRFPQVAESQPELLAYHYTESGDIEPAVAYWQKASEQAARRSAHTEAIAHLKRGLEVIASLANDAIRVQHELTLHISLGSILLSTKGYADPEVEQIYAHALKLCQQMGDSAQHMRILLGLHSYYQLRGELEAAYELSEELLQLSRAQGDTALVVQAYQATSHTLFFQGKLTSARQYAEQGLALYDPEEHRSWTFSSGMGNLQVQGLSRLSWILGPLGYPGQAVARINEALEIANEFNHPFSLASTLAFATWVYRQRREPHRVIEPAEELMSIAQEHGFAFQWARGLYIQGWAKAMLGDFSEGIDQMQEGMSAMLETGTSLGLSGWLSGLAAAYARQGQLDDAYRYVIKALQAAEQHNIPAGRPELDHLFAEILLEQGGKEKCEEAETHLHQALTTARDQEAKLYELRAATSLARLWQFQGKRQEAYELLAPVYEWFTEGFDTADLKDAKTLLAELAQGK